MNIPLNEFEQHINETILKRGLKCFQDGAVQSIDEISKDNYFALVEGSEIYEVNLTISNKIIKSIDCSCPFDGQICKHAVAVMFAMQADTLQLHDEQIQKTMKTKRPPKEKALKPKEELKIILNKLEKEELVASILELVAKDKSMLFQLLTKYSILNQEQTQDFYFNQVNNIINIAMDRNGFVDYYNVRKIVKPFIKLIDTAKQAVEDNNTATAIFICNAMILKLGKVLPSVADSDGHVFSFIEEAIVIMNSMAEMADEYLKDKFLIHSLNFLNCFKEDETDFYDQLVKLAANCISKKEQIAMLSPFLVSNSIGNYYRELFKKIEHQLILRFEGELKANEFVFNHLDYSHFRTLAVEQAIKKLDYNYAKQLLKEAIIKDKEWPGLQYNWRLQLLHIAELENDHKEVIEISLKLFFSHHHDFKYYHKAKKHASADEWPTIVAKILTLLNKPNHWKPYDTIAQVYFEEKEPDKLLELITSFASFELLEKYEKILNQHYPNELISLYERSIRKYLIDHVGRNYYVIACSALKRLKNILPNKNVNYLVDELLQKYKQRKALVELLNEI